VVPAHAVLREVAAGVLVAVALRVRAVERRLGLVTAASEPLSPAAAAFAEIARGALGAAAATPAR
jgi:hypothetical protein